MKLTSHPPRRSSNAPARLPLRPPFLETNFAMQSTPKHIAIIMDGNRRWARERNLPTLVGHRRGLSRVMDLLKALKSSEVKVLTLFGFSSANWQRSRSEVGYLLELADEALRRAGPLACRDAVRVEVIGRRDRLPDALVERIEQIEQDTRQGGRLLRLALDYSSREAMLEVARQVDSGCSAEQFSQLLTQSPALGNNDLENVDLLIRTGREQRLSDFLLWECAFSELYFPDLYWPEFDARALGAAIAWYQQRERRFGA
jgi:undecaprenyl diphosphate synthase